jgi:hypothetical protein
MDQPIKVVKDLSDPIRLKIIKYPNHGRRPTDADKHKGLD